MKVPPFRDLYQKVGTFGMAEAPGIEPYDNGFMGDRIRGFSFLHDGADRKDSLPAHSSEERNQCVRRR